MTHPERAPEVDLHGLKPSEAVRRVAQGLHTARVRGSAELLVITGRGWGNRLQEPTLRRHIESWLKSPEGRRAGAGAAHPTQGGGALRVELRR